MAIVSAVGQMASSSEVRVRVLYRSAQTIAALQGELDIMTAPGLRERLLGVLIRPSPAPPRSSASSTTTWRARWCCA